MTHDAEAARREANALQAEVEALYGQGRFEQAVGPAQRCVALFEQTFGTEHPDLAASLINLAVVYLAQGAYRDAERLCARGVEILERAHGPDHLNVASGLANLALIHDSEGEYAKAEPLYVRALAIREQVLGPMHQDVAANLNNLAALYHARGRYQEAESLYARALGIYERVLGPGDPVVAASLNNLAVLHQHRGAYGKAEPLLVRALDIAQQALGPTHPDVAATMANLALLFQRQGAYDKAEPLYRRALAISEPGPGLGPGHPDVLVQRSNLASLYEDQGAHDQAEQLYVRALETSEAVLGAAHPEVALALNNLAGIYQRQRRFSEAEQFLLRARAIWERALGPAHRDVATCLHNLALLYEIAGEPDKAESLHIRALEIHEQALGPVHPLVAKGLSSLAWFHCGVGAPERALPLLARASEIEELELRVELARLAEPRKRALMRLIEAATHCLVSLSADIVPSSEEARDLAFTAVLRRKGRILDSLVDHEAVLRAHLTPPLREQVDDLRRARSELVAQLYLPAEVHDAARAAATRTRIEDLESALSAASAEFRVQAEPVTVARIRAALPEHAALVEFARYRRFDPRLASAPWQDERYVAYLLTRDRPPSVIPLGEAARLDAAVDAALAAMRGEVAGDAAPMALRRLDALVFAPVRERLTGVSHVILAPDGKLNLVPFDALVGTDGRYALDQLLFSYVTSGRDLLRFATPRAPRSPAVIMAGPDYGPSSPVGAMTFVPLPGALGEAADLQQYFSAPALIGACATKSVLAMLAGPAILHVATHGFYAGPTGVSTAAARDVDVHDERWWAPAPGPEDPADSLDRAGLALAGANQGAAGIVTAREIAGFDWWGTQLVILSACQTGVGAAPSGDSVYGMRRALVLAGTGSQVVSLWSVGDLSTRQLMGALYRELVSGTGPAEALRRAKTRLMQEPRHAHPSHWAAFISAGDWRPLDPSVFPQVAPVLDRPA